MHQQTSRIGKTAIASLCAVALGAGTAGATLAFQKQDTGSRQQFATAATFDDIAQTAGTGDYENDMPYDGTETGADVVDALKLSGDDARTITEMSAEEFADSLSGTELFEIDETADGHILIAPFASKRIAMSADALDALPADAGEPLYDPMTGSYILTFDTMTQTADVFAKISDNAPEGSAMVDVKIKAMATSAYEGWGTEDMGLNAAEDLLDARENTPNVTVAVIDSGVRATHGVFAGAAISEASGSFISARGASRSSSDFTDENGHGTHVAGIIADGTPSSVSLMALKCLDADGAGSLYDAYYAMFYAAANGADVVNMSFGADFGTGRSARSAKAFFDRGLKAITDKGGLVVAAASNEGRDMDAYGTYPATSSYAVSVGALDSAGNRASYSNYGDSLDFVAPGSSIKSAWNSSDSASLTASGTSMAAPHIAALAADLASIYPEKSPSELVELMKELSQDLGTPGKDAYYGYGKPVFDMTALPEVQVGTITDENAPDDQQIQVPENNSDDDGGQASQDRPGQQPQDGQAGNGEQQPATPGNDDNGNGNANPDNGNAGGDFGGGKPSNPDRPWNGNGDDGDWQQPQLPDDGQQPSDQERPSQPQQPVDQQPSGQPATEPAEKPEVPSIPKDDDSSNDSAQPAPGANEEEQQPVSPSESDNTQQQPAQDTVGKTDITNGEFIVANWSDRYYYTGKAIEPDINIYRCVRHGWGWHARTTYQQLTQGTDFTVKYENNVEPGRAKVVIEGAGDYCGSAELEFTIVKKQSSFQRNTPSRFPWQRR